MMQQNLVDLPRFAIYYGKEFSDTTSSPKGILTLGGSKEDFYVQGNITWIPMRQETELQVWRAPFKSISGTYTRATAGDITSNSTSNSASISTTVVVSSGRAVFDTGAGSISVPDELIEEVYASIGMNWTAVLSGKHIPLCSKFDGSWSVSFNFGESDSYDDRYTITMTGKELARPGFAGSDEYCNPPFDSSGSWGLVLFGTPLLQKRYTVWDFGAREVDAYEPRLGFGKLKVEWRL